MVTSPKALLRGYDWLDTLAHEYTHLVVTQTGHNSVPIWLHEALAKYLESRWRGPAGQGAPALLARLLADRVKKNKLIPFAKMHPSMAKLPTSKDAATAFAEVFFAVEYLHKEHGMRSLRTIVEALGTGATTSRRWRRHRQTVPGPSRRPGWPTSARSRPRRRAPASPRSGRCSRGERPAAEEGKKGRDISFGDFARGGEPGGARRWAHLGELFRERGRFVAAAEEYGKAHAPGRATLRDHLQQVRPGADGGEALDEAEKVLLGSLETHPGYAATQRPPRTHLPEPRQ